MGKRMFLSAGVFDGKCSCPFWNVHFVGFGGVCRESRSCQTIRYSGVKTMETLRPALLKEPPAS